MYVTNVFIYGNRDIVNLPLTVQNVIHLIGIKKRLKMSKLPNKIKHWILEQSIKLNNWCEKHEAVQNTTTYQYEKMIREGKL